MHVVGLIAGCLLLGQAPTAIVSSPAASTRIQPPEMVAEAVRLLDGSTLTGQPVTLLSALTSTQDRRQQLELTRAYWRLAQGVAEYHFCLDHLKRLQGTNPADDQSRTLRVAVASAAAMLRQAELEAAGSQYELARLMRLPAGAPLPLPVDRPHVGAYRTNFQELFAGRTAPESAVLMDRVLPIWRQVVDEQAAAVQAAEDVLAEKDGNAVLHGQELLRQQRAFIRAVCDYNGNIAEYGLAVAGPLTNPQALVAMLIGPAQQPTPAAVAGNPSVPQSGAAIGNSLQQPSPTDPAASSPRTGWRSGPPTGAPPTDGPRKNEPTLAPPRDGRRSAAVEPPGEATRTDAVRAVSNDEESAPPPQAGLQPVGKNEPTLAPPRGALPNAGSEAESANQHQSINPSEPPIQTESANLPQKPLVPIESSTAAPQRETPPREEAPLRTARKPVDAAATSLPTAASPLYSALVDAAPAARAKQLTVALNWDRALPKGIGRPMSLAECLMRDPGTDRRATIEGFWHVRQLAAEYQVCAQELEFLEGLAPLVLEHHNDPLGAVGMLRLHWTRLAAKASLSAAHAALVEAQFALALKIGATRDPEWPLPATVPHSGSYLLRLEAQPPSVVESWPVRRLTTAIPGLSTTVLQQAVAVVEADAARVAAAERYRTGSAPLDPAIEAVRTQTRETLAILATLADYNRAIAEYVLAVLPPATPVAKLVSALVVNP